MPTQVFMGNDWGQLWKQISRGCVPFSNSSLTFRPPLPLVVVSVSLARDPAA